MLLLRRAFTGAWIETSDETKESPEPESRAFTGAWIETQFIRERLGKQWCRAFTGAWIETIMLMVDETLPSVAPSQARGLKHPVLLL